LKQRFREIHLDMIGPDKGDGTFQAAKALAQELGLASNVTFPGAVPKAEIPAWLDTADIFINTTNIDNTPVSVLEAMACGLCVVTTNVGGIPYLLEDGRNALLVPPDSADAMAGGVARLLADDALAERISRNARALAEPLDWPAILDRWESLLESTAGYRSHERHAAAVL
jgi:glycosyltransferase involved in cell wall biosynthesis